MSGTGTLALRRACALIPCILILVVATAAAAVIHVPGDAATIQAGINLANAGDTVSVAPDTYTGAGNKELDFNGRDLVLIGTGGSAQTAIDCEGAGRGIHLHEGETGASRIEGFTIVNGNASNGGGICFEGAGAMLQDIAILDCTATGGGGLSINQAGFELFGLEILIARCSASTGGALKNGSTTLTLDQLTMAGNSATNYGSAIWNYASQVTISRAILAYNTGPAGVYAIQVNSPPNYPDFVCSDFIGNVPGTVYSDAYDPVGTAGNFSLAPLFCDRPGGDFSLHALSPCLPSGNDCAQQVGALGQGCDYPLHTIVGVLRTEAAQGIAGVELLGAPYPLVSDENGIYVILVPTGWSGTITPEHESYVFTPLSRSYADMQADALNQDYVGAHDPIIHVPGEFATIQDALDYAQYGDTIFVAPGTYSGEGFGALDFPNLSVSLIGKAGAEQTIIEWDYDVPGWSAIEFDGEGPGTLVQGLTFTGFPVYYQGGAILCESGSRPTLRELIFVDNHGSVGYPNDAYGGGLYCTGGSAPRLEHCEFRSNAASQGGAAYIGGSSPEFYDCEFLFNDAQDGGALAISGGAPHFERCRFVGNTANRAWTDDVVFESGAGGAVTAHGSSSATFLDCHFDGNVAEHSWEVPPYYSDNSPGHGGAIRARDTLLHIEGCTFVDNAAIPNDVGVGGCLDFGGTGVDQLLNSIVASSPYGAGILLAGGATEPTVSCSDVWDHPDGNYVGLADQTGVGGNLSVLPRFCAPLSADYSLDASSPCLPENNACGVLMGAHGEGCSGNYLDISGRIADGADTGIADVALTGGYVSVTTDAQGEYVIATPPGWSGTVTPTLEGFSFTPPARDYVALGEDQLDQDYLAIASTSLVVPDMYATIQAAFDASSAGDTVLLRPGVYGGDGNCELVLPAHPLVLLGEAGAAETVLEDPAGRRALIVNQGQGLGTQVRGLTLRGCTTESTGLAILCESASPHLQDLVIADCGAGLSQNRWGALGVIYDSQPLVEGCLFTGNEIARGGAVHVGGGAAPLFRDCRFEDNRGIRGGALHLVSEGSTAAFERCLFAGNTSETVGGESAAGAAIYLRDTTLNLLSCTLHGNQGMGAVYAESGSVELAQCIVAENSGAGGLVNVAGAWLLSCNNVWGNTAEDYAGLAGQTGLNGNISADPLLCDPASGRYGLQAGSPCLPPYNGCGLLMGAYGEDCDWTPAESTPAPDGLTLLANHPNPFNPSTAIRFGLPAPGAARLTVYAADGRRVATLLDGATLRAGWHEVEWRGRSAEGRAQPSGIYFARLEAAGAMRTGKLLLLK